MDTGDIDFVSFKERTTLVTIPRVATRIVRMLKEEISSMTAGAGALNITDDVLAWKDEMVELYNKVIKKAAQRKDGGKATTLAVMTIEKHSSSPTATTELSEIYDKLGEDLRVYTAEMLTELIVGSNDDVTSIAEKYCGTPKGEKTKYTYHKFELNSKEAIKLTAYGLSKRVKERFEHGSSTVRNIDELYKPVIRCIRDLATTSALGAGQNERDANVTSFLILIKKYLTINGLYHSLADMPKVYALAIHVLSEEDAIFKKPEIEAFLSTKHILQKNKKGYPTMTYWYDKTTQLSVIISNQRNGYAAILNDVNVIVASLGGFDTAAVTAIYDEFNLTLQSLEKEEQEYSVVNVAYDGDIKTSATMCKQIWDGTDNEHQIDGGTICDALRLVRKSGV